jgi:hypothetical protein
MDVEGEGEVASTTRKQMCGADGGAVMVVGGQHGQMSPVRIDTGVVRVARSSPARALRRAEVRGLARGSLRLYFSDRLATRCAASGTLKRWPRRLRDSRTKKGSRTKYQRMLIFWLNDHKQPRSPGTPFAHVRTGIVRALSCDGRQMTRQPRPPGVVVVHKSQLAGRGAKIAHHQNAMSQLYPHTLEAIAPRSMSMDGIVAWCMGPQS